jgi:hypothetical protein
LSPTRRPTAGLAVEASVASGTRSRSTTTIDDQWRLGCARAADRAALAKHVGIVEAATVPLCVMGAALSNSNVTEYLTVMLLLHP